MRLNINTGRLLAAVAGTALAACFAAAPARADVVGALQCNIAPGEGAIIVSQRAVSCTFMSSAGPTQLYNGYINRLGVDIGNQTSGTLTYNVVAIGTPAPGSLTGDYIGPGFGISLGSGGGGANALVGGGNSFSLQPVSGTTSTGVNINAGVGELHLTYAGMEGGAMGRRHHRRYHHMKVHRHHHM